MSQERELKKKKNHSWNISFLLVFTQKRKKEIRENVVTILRRVLRQSGMPQGTEPSRQSSSEANSRCGYSEKWEAAVSSVPVLSAASGGSDTHFSSQTLQWAWFVFLRLCPTAPTPHFWSCCFPAWPRKQGMNYQFNCLIYKYSIINISRKMHPNIEHVGCVQRCGEDNNNHSKVISEVISKWVFFSS